MFKDTITLFHTTDNENYTRLHLSGVYFFKRKKITENINGSGNASSGIIRIPSSVSIEYDQTYEDLQDTNYNQIYLNDLQITTDDYVIEGKIEEEWNFKTLTRKYNLYKVLEVSKNFRGSLPHYKLEVSG